MDRIEIESLSGKELVATFNRLTGEAVKKFANHATGVRRVLAALDKAQAEKPAVEAAPEPKSKPAAATKATAAPPPVEAAPAVETPATVADDKAPRPGSKRERLLVELRKPAGLTLEQMAAMFEWKPNDCRDALRLLRTKNGINAIKSENGTSYHVEE